MPPHISSHPASSEPPRPVRIAIVGYGNAGSKYAGLIARGMIPGAVLSAIVARHASLPSTVAPTRFPSLADLVAARAADAVIIATPHPSHPELAGEAAAAGLHVLVEKPLAVTIDEARRLAALPAAPRQVRAVMLDRRLNPLWQYVRAEAQSANFGPLRRINWTATDWLRTDAYYKSAPWRGTWSGEGGGVLINQALHDLDLLAWIAGGLPRRVIAWAAFGRDHDIETEDNVSALLEWESGCTGHFTASNGEAPGIQRAELVGEGGLVQVERTTTTIHHNATRVRDFLRTCPEPFPKMPATFSGQTFAADFDSAAATIARFVSACQGHKAAELPTWDDALASVELANALILSAESGAPADLPLPAGAATACLRRLAAKHGLQM